MSECAVSHGTSRDGEPKTERATHGRLCKHHAERLTAWLDDIARDYTMLGLVIPPGVTGDRTRRAKGDEAAAPINLAAAALTDTGRGGVPRDYGQELWYELPDIPSVLDTIHVRAEDVRCVLDPSREPNYDVKDIGLVTEIGYLQAAFETFIEQDDIDEAFEEIKRVWATLQSVHGRPRPRSLGHCLNVDCDGLVRERPQASPWCTACKRIYDTPSDWARIAIEEEKRRAQRKATA